MVMSDRDETAIVAAKNKLVVRVLYLALTGARAGFTNIASNNGDKEAIYVAFAAGGQV